VPQVSRTGWKKIKASFAAYRSWAASKPETSAAAKAALVEEEKILRYRRYLGEFLENYVTMKHLYDDGKLAMFQMGVLRIDGKEMNLCFHVENEASHSALSGKSKCCVLYLKLTRPSEGVVRSVCAVVTAGTIGGLYVGRNGVFYDYDGKDWDAVVTKVVEAQVSLLEAFWSPWRKLGESIASTVKKFLGDKQAAADAKLSSSVEKAASAKSSDSAASASLASSIAAIGIGVGFIGAAAASLMASLSRLSPWQIGGSIVALVLVVSLPSMFLAYFNLRKRDLGAILNAGGWAVNRPMKLSMKKSRDFTKCAKNKGLFALFAVFALIIALLVAGSQFFSERKSSVECPQESAQCAAPEASDSISK
jgi:F0F1-type ATP synthase membrane subunit c/vacuolar-type H+-ATPase subunit K